MGAKADIQLFEAAGLLHNDLAAVGLLGGCAVDG